MLLHHTFLNEVANTAKFIPRKKIIKNIPYYNVFPDCNSTNTYNISDFIRISNVTTNNTICLIGNIMIASDFDFKVNVAFPFLQTGTSSATKYGFEYTSEFLNPLLILASPKAKTLEQVRNFIEYPVARVVCQNEKACTFDIQPLPLSYVLENTNIGRKVIVNTDLEKRVILDVVKNQANSTTYSTSAVFLGNFQGDFVYTKGKKDTINVPESYDELCNSIEGSSIIMHTDANVPPLEKYASYVSLAFQPITDKPNLQSWFFKPFTIILPVKSGIFPLKSVLNYEFPLPQVINDTDVDVATPSPDANPISKNVAAFGLLIGLMSILFASAVGLYLYYFCMKRNSRLPSLLNV